MTTANQSAAERNITLVSVANIQPSNYNPRKRFDETGLDELAESIKQQGVLQPITVRPIADTDRYEIVFGERRYRASVIAGLEEVPAIISELSDEEAQEWRSQRTCSVKTLLLRKKPMLISNSLIVGGIR